MAIHTAGVAIIVGAETSDLIKDKTWLLASIPLGINALISASVAGSEVQTIKDLTERPL